MIVNGAGWDTFIAALYRQAPHHIGANKASDFKCVAGFLLVNVNIDEILTNMDRNDPTYLEIPIRPQNPHARVENEATI